MKRLIIVLAAGAAMTACGSKSKPSDPNDVASVKANSRRAAARKAIAAQERKRMTIAAQKRKRRAATERDRIVRLDNCWLSYGTAVVLTEKIADEDVRKMTVLELSALNTKCPDHAEGKIDMPGFSKVAAKGERKAEWNTLTPAQRRRREAAERNMLTSGQQKERREAAERSIQKDTKQRAKDLKKSRASAYRMAVATYLELRGLYILGSGKMDRLRRSSNSYVGRRCITLLRRHRPRTLSIAEDARVVEDHNGKLFVALIGAASRMSGCVTCSRTLGPKRCRQVRSYLRRARAALRREGHRVPAVR